MRLWNRHKGPIWLILRLKLSLRLSSRLTGAKLRTAARHRWPRRHWLTALGE
jgi:hypothetical protein